MSYENGYHFGYGGGREDQNPNPPGSTEAQEWLKGFNDGVKAIDERARAAREQAGEAALITTQGPALPAEGELTDEEAARYAELQQVIADGMKDFVRVGQALREIRDRRLYRETHDTFETFARDIYEMSTAYSSRVIGASETYQYFVANWQQIDMGVTPDTSNPPAILPQNEAQCRALIRLKDPNDRLAAWRRAVQKGLENQGRVTATLVARVVKEMRGENVANKTNDTKNKLRTSPDLPDEMKAAMGALCDLVRAYARDDWKGINKGLVLESLRDLTAAVEA